MANNTAQAIQKVYAKNNEKLKRQNIVIGQAATRKFEGQLKDGGETIKICTESPVTLTDLSFAGGPVSYDDIDITAQEMRVDQYPSCAFKLNKTEQVQLKTGKAKEIITDKISRMNYEFTLHQEDNLASTYTDCGLVFDASTLNSGVITKAYAMEFMNEMSVLAKENNLDPMKMDAFLPPWLVGRLELDSTEYTEKGFDIRQNGWMGKAAGFSVYESNSIVEDSSDYWYPLFVVRDEALALAVQEEPTVTDASRPNYHEEAYKAVNIYAYKNFRPDKSMTASNMKRSA